MTKQKASGDRGETVACAYLRTSGYTLLRRNFRNGNNEIDIIAKKDGVLVFIEVKSRNSVTYGYPESMVGKRQQKSILKAATLYMERISWDGMIRFDIIAIEWRGTGHRLCHFEDAFY